MTEKQNQESGSFQQNNRKTYLHYTREMRLKLIKLVDSDKLSTAEAGRQVGIKQTSACRIMKSYYKHNRIFEKKEDRLLREAQFKLEGRERGLEIQNIGQIGEKPCFKKQKKELEGNKNEDKEVIVPIESRRQNTEMRPEEMFPLSNMLPPPTPLYCLDGNYFPLYFPGTWSLPFFYE